MADETATQPEGPADDREPPQSDGRSEGQEPSKGQKIKAGAAKAVLAVGNWLDSPVKNKVKDYGYKNNGQMIAGRVDTAFNWGVDSVTKPIDAAIGAFANNKFEDLIVGVPMAMAEQLLAILDGLNNWIKNIERHPELGQIKDNGNITGNIPRPEKTDTRTQNLAKPERSDEPTKNLGNDGKTDNKTQNIPTPTNTASSNEGATGNIPPAQTNAGRGNEQPAQTTESSIGAKISNLSTVTEKIADTTMKVSAFVAPIIPEAAMVTGAAATVKAVAQQGQQLGETLDPKSTAQTTTPPVNAPRSNTLSSNTPPANTPTITQKGKSTPPAGLKLDNIAAFFSDKTITVKNDAIANLNQSRTARDNANQCKQLGNMLAMIKNRNNSRVQTQSMGLTLGNRTASRA